MKFFSRRSLQDNSSLVQKKPIGYKKNRISRKDYLESSYRSPYDIFETSKYLAFPDFRNDESTYLIYCFKKETYCRNKSGSPLFETFDPLMEFDARFLTNGIEGTVRFGEYRFSSTFSSYVFEVTEPEDARHLVLMINTNVLPCAGDLGWLKNSVFAEKVVSLESDSPFLCIIMNAATEIDFVKKEVDDNSSPYGPQATYQRVYESFVMNYFDRNYGVLEYAEVLTEEERKKQALLEEEEEKERAIRKELMECSRKLGQSICENLKKEQKEVLEFFGVTLSVIVDDCRPSPELIFRIVPQGYHAAVFTKRIKNPLELRTDKIVAELRDAILAYFAKIRPQFEAFSSVSKAERAFLDENNISSLGYASDYPLNFFKQY
ncbi:hypothetical protein IKF81_02655 [Candidatus Saccharibacteria bacterium]|nr:hypothetical protein [Candidatus Saccharibacteria bacterium]